MSDVFISYAKEDQACAKILVDVLTEQGWSVWWDHDIPPGKTWDEAIGKEINGASCVIVLWSKASVASKWVFNEALRGKERGVLIPVLIEAGVAIPAEFSLIHATDLTGWDGQTPSPGLDPLLKEVKAILARASRRRFIARVGIGVLVIAVLATVYVSQQQGDQLLPLAGQVVEEGTGTPIAGAQLTILGDRGTGTTDEQGYFHIELQGTPFERVEVMVSHPSYESKREGLALSDGHLISLERTQ